MVIETHLLQQLMLDALLLAVLSHLYQNRVEGVFESGYSFLIMLDKSDNHLSQLLLCHVFAVRGMDGGRSVILPVVRILKVNLVVCIHI